jgi:hypothetical protein
MSLGADGEVDAIEPGVLDCLAEVGPAQIGQMFREEAEFAAGRRGG